MSSAHGRRGGMAAGVGSPPSDDEVEEVPNPNSTRTTRSQATLTPKNKSENIREGRVNCPECFRYSLWREYGCKLVHCRYTNEHPFTRGWVYFCFFCKKRCEGGMGFVNCNCSWSNTMENREKVLAQRQSEQPVGVDDSEDEEASSESAGGATTPSSDVSSGESSETESRRQDSDDGSWKESDAGDEGGDPPSFVGDEQSRSELTSGDAPPPAKRIKTEPVKSEEVETDEEAQLDGYSWPSEVKMEEADVKDEETDTESSSGKDASGEHRSVGAGEEKTESAGKKKPARKKSRARGGETTATKSAPRARARRSAAVKAAAKLSGDIISEEDSGSDGDSFALDDASLAGSEGESMEGVEHDDSDGGPSKSNQKRGGNQRAPLANKGKSRDERWNEQYEQLRAYKAERGNCNVPQSYGVLGKWASKQRQYFSRGQRSSYKKGKLLEERKQRLEEIGFQWSVGSDRDLEERWMEQYDQLRAYKDEYGHCNVPKKHAELGSWVNTQRQEKKRDKLSVDRIQRLDGIGFQWTGRWGGSKPDDGLWNERLEQLVAFKAEHEHCKVPQRYAKNPQLGKWVKRQRQAFKNGKLADERKMLLEDIGFRF